VIRLQSSGKSLPHAPGADGRESASPGLARNLQLTLAGAKHMTENRRKQDRTPYKQLALATAACTLIGSAAWAQDRSTGGLTEPVAAIRAAAVAYVRSELPASEVTDATAGGLDDRLRLPRCATALKVEPTAGTSTMARATVGVSCAEPVHWMIYVPVTVVRRVSVLVLRHAVARGAHVAAADVTVENREVTGVSQAFLGSPAELSGRSVERILAAGTPLTVDMFTADPVVHRGQEVTLVAQADGIEVRAAGRALEDARPGARLKVENMTSEKVVEGVAESSGIVAVGE
jgi:flagellar basal body P-ring formation protein FlgA